MKFVDIKNHFGELKKSLQKETSQSFLSDITVVEPSRDRSELDFLNLVTWCYVAIYEAGSPVLQQLGALARSSDPLRSNEAMRVRENVQNLRSARFHNLPEGSQSNEYKLRQATIWLKTNGGEPIEWKKCCRALCSEMSIYFELIMTTWNDAIAVNEDKEQIVQQLVTAKEKKWEAHEYDEIVVEMAESLEITGLDIVAYRTYHLNHWQRVTAFFTDRESARSGISAVIHNDLLSSFKPRSD